MKHIITIILFISIPFINSYGELTSSSVDSIVQTVDTLNNNASNAEVADSTAEVDTIYVRKSSGSIYGYNNGVLLTYQDYKNIFEIYPKALDEIKTANFLHKTGKVFADVGGYMFGFTLALGLKDLQSVDYTWGIVLGASAAVAGIGFVIYSSGNSHQMKAIHIYNSMHRNFMKDVKIRLKLGFTNNGVGLVCCF